MTHPPQPAPFGQPGQPGHQGGFPGPSGHGQAGYQSHPGHPGWHQGAATGRLGADQGPLPGPVFGQSHHHPGPYPPQGGMPGQYPPPRPSPTKKTGLWLALSAAALAITAFLVTGLLAPGFLLGDDEDSNTTAVGTGVELGDSEAAAVASEFVTAFSDQDAATLNSLVCPGREAMLRGYADEAEFVTGIEPTGGIEERAGTANLTVRMVYEYRGERSTPTFRIGFDGRSGPWCWTSLDMLSKT